MKRIGLILTCIFLFAISLYVAYMQGVNFVDINGPAGVHLAAKVNGGIASLSPFWAKFLSVFVVFFNALVNVFGGSLIAGIIVVALLIELMTLYSAVNIQLKQKKIHMFHKKLVDRFHRGELSMSESKRELDVLYSVNERIHRRGALLFLSQLFVFLIVFTGLYLMAHAPSLLDSAFSSFNFAMLSAPKSFVLPLLASLAYLLHSLVKIYVKQREDYIDSRQVYIALGISLIISLMVYYFASIVAVLLTVYFLTQITFATMRFVIVEEKSKDWGKFIQRELIKMLKSSKLHKNKVQHWTRIFHHVPVVRHLNFHLLEEAMSMSLAIVLFANALTLT